MRFHALSRGGRGWLAGLEEEDALEWIRLIGTRRMPGASLSKSELECRPNQSWKVLIVLGPALLVPVIPAPRPYLA
jgi:hypothetical protein